MVHLLHIALRRRRQLQKGIPGFLVARIALQQIPGAGIAFFSDLAVIKRQRVQTFFRCCTGFQIALCALLRGLPDIAGKGFRFRLDGVLHRIAGRVVRQQGVKGPHRPAARHRGNAHRQQGHQQDGNAPSGDLGVQRKPFPLFRPAVHTASPLSPNLSFSILAFGPKCNRPGNTKPRHFRNGKCRGVVLFVFQQSGQFFQAVQRLV